MTRMSLPTKCPCMSGPASPLSPWPLPAVRVTAWSPVGGSQHLQVASLDLRSADSSWWEGRPSREVLFLWSSSGASSRV